MKVGKLLIVLVVIVLISGVFLGKWCCYNTELLTSHYLEKEVILPDFPFIAGAYITQCGIPYGIITEIWTRCIGVKPNKPENVHTGSITFEGF